MDSPGRMREQVTERLSGLEVAYGSFPVNQTTVSLSADRYERERQRLGGTVAEVHVKVENDAEEVLHVSRGDVKTLPIVEIRPGVNFEREIETDLRENTGIDCSVDGPERATIVGVRNGDGTDADQFYYLVVRLACTKTDGHPDDHATWERDQRLLREIRA